MQRAAVLVEVKDGAWRRSSSRSDWPVHGSLIFLALLQDGITTGAIYLLLAIGLLIIFSVTRVIFVPQGDLLAFGTLTAASLQSGQCPGTLWLLDGVSRPRAARIVASAAAACRAGLGRLSACSDAGHAAAGAARAAGNLDRCSRSRSSRRWAR